MAILDLHNLPDKRLYEVSRQLNLYQQLSEDEGVHALIRHASELFKSPVALLDPKFRLITKATPDGIRKPECISLNVKGVCACDGVSCFKNSRIKDMVDRSNEPIYVADPDGSTPARIMWKVAVNGRVLAYFVIFESGVSLDEISEIHLASTLADVIGLVLRQRSTLLLLEQGDMGSLLASILSGQFVGQSEINDQLELYNLPQHNHYQMLLIPGVQENHQFLSIDFLAKRFAEVGRLPYFFYRDGSYILLFAEHELAVLRGLEATVIEVLKESSLKASMSERFTALSELNWQLDLCEKLYEHCEAKHAADSVYRLGSHILAMFLSGQLNSSERQLVHPDIKLLFDHDKDNHSELLKTWITYIKEHKHLNRTSELLGIHKNTLIYRVKKIQDMTTSIGQESDDIFYQLYSYEQLTQTKV